MPAAGKNTARFATALDVRYVVPNLGTTPLVRTVHPARPCALRSSTVNVATPVHTAAGVEAKPEVEVDTVEAAAEVDVDDVEGATAVLEVEVADVVGVVSVVVEMVDETTPPAAVVVVVGGVVVVVVAGVVDEAGVLVLGTVDDAVVVATVLETADAGVVVAVDGATPPTHTKRTASAATFSPPSDLTNTPAPTVSAVNVNLPSERNVVSVGCTVWSTSTRVTPPACTTSCGAIVERAVPAAKNTCTSYVPGGSPAAGKNTARFTAKLDVRYVAPNLGTTPLVRTVHPARPCALRSSTNNSVPAGQTTAGAVVVVVDPSVVVVATVVEGTASPWQTKRTASAATFSPPSDLTNTPAPVVLAKKSNVPSE